MPHLSERGLLIEERRRRICELLRAGQADLYGQDEADLALLPTLTRTWMPRDAISIVLENISAAGAGALFSISDAGWRPSDTSPSSASSKSSVR